MANGSSPAADAHKGSSSKPAPQPGCSGSADLGRRPVERQKGDGGSNGESGMDVDRPTPVPPPPVEPFTIGGDAPPPVASQTSASAPSPSHVHESPALVSQPPAGAPRPDGSSHTLNEQHSGTAEAAHSESAGKKETGTGMNGVLLMQCNGVGSHAASSLDPDAATQQQPSADETLTPKHRRQQGERMGTIILGAIICSVHHFNKSGCL